MSRWKKLLVTAIVTVVAVGAIAVGGLYLTLKQRAVEYASPTSPTGRQADLAALRGTRVFFGHQSVGDNILGGLARLFDDSGTPRPPVQKISTAAEVTQGAGGRLIHAQIGRNGNPASKFAAFDALMRAGMADHVDVALMKLCYVDFGRRTDPRDVFEHYRRTMTALERDFPKVTFIYTTVPLMTTDGYRNNLRTQFNSLVRREFRDKVVFDIAEVESRSPDGSRATGSTLGFPYEQLQAGYASDGAHLNRKGAQVVAEAFVATVNEAAQ
jgi:hypothetical protein